MKLLRAHIRNFQAFDDVVVDFSTDAERTITLIRADMGKTSFLEALEWGLFGHKALTAGGSPLQPLDAGPSDEPTTVAIDYVVTEASNEPQQFRLVRYAWPWLGGDRPPDSTTLELLDPAGGDAKSIRSPESTVPSRAQGEQSVFLKRIDSLALLAFVGSEVGDGANAVEAALKTLPKDSTGLRERVSECMNHLFLDAAGSRAVKAGVRGVRITPDCRIVATALDGSLRSLSELSAAIRCTLAMSFVTATAAASRTDGCVFLDDALRLLDVELLGPVLQLAAERCPQLIMAVNPRPDAADEVLDRYVGRSRTLSLVADYPQLLAHDPGKTWGAVSCDCDHRSQCRCCERR